MKISLKIFIFTYCIIMVITVVGGFILLYTLYEREMNQAMEQAAADNEMLYTYVAVIEEFPDSTYMEVSLTGLKQRMSGSDRKNPVFIGDYAAWKRQILPEDTQLANGQMLLRIVEIRGEKMIQVTSRRDDIYIINYYDIMEILARRDANYKLYHQIIILASGCIAVILYLFAWSITRPLVRVTRMAERMAGGDYQARIDASYVRMKSKEVQKLGNTLNHLAANTEDYIGQLKDMARQKEEFMGNFTHELKTPMTSIIGYADLLRTYDLEPQKQWEYGNYIYQEGRRLEQLAQNLLQLIVVGNTQIEWNPIHTTQLFARVKEMVHFLGEKYKLVISLHYEPAVIVGEMALLTTVIQNLVDNACKASKEGAQVLVEARCIEEEYWVTVTDHGTGIPLEELKKITEPFYMVDKSRARSQGGAGLGLALCKRIIELHHGTIEFYSRQNEGTVVRIALLLSKEAPHE